MEKILSGVKEQTVILQILSDYINSRETVVYSDIDFDILIQLAKSQEVDGVVYYQLSKSSAVDSAKLAPLQQKFAFSLYVYKNRMALLEKIEKALTEAKIPFFIFKGSEIASLYPIPALRTMGDSDILVHPDDKEKAHDVFENLGLVRTEFGSNEWVYDYKGMEFELHCRLMNEGEVGNYDSHKAFMYRHWDYATAEPGAYHYHLDMSYHFVFLILHLRKHFINSGVGFRQFMDLAVVMQKCELDWDFIKEELVKMDLLGFAETCLSLCDKWFGVPSPLSSEIEDAFADETTERILKGGVFGFDDNENANNYRILQINKAGNTKWTRLKMTIDGLFPSYDTLRVVSHYRFVDGKPYLLPIAWAWRFIRSIFHGRVSENYKTASKTLDISKEKVIARTEYLKKWKLK